MTRTSLGRQILERLIKDVEPHSIVEFRPRQEGNTLHAILAPKKSEKDREKERATAEKEKARAEKKDRNSAEMTVEKAKAAAQSAPAAVAEVAAKPAS